MKKNLVLIYVLIVYMLLPFARLNAFFPFRQAVRYVTYAAKLPAVFGRHRQHQRIMLKPEPQTPAPKEPVKKYHPPVVRTPVVVQEPVKEVVLESINKPSPYDPNRSLPDVVYQRTAESFIAHWQEQAKDQKIKNFNYQQIVGLMQEHMHYRIEWYKHSMTLMLKFKDLMLEPVHVFGNELIQDIKHEHKEIIRAMAKDFNQRIVFLKECAIRYKLGGIIFDHSGLIDIHVTYENLPEEKIMHVLLNQPAIYLQEGNTLAQKVLDILAKQRGEKDAKDKK